MKEPIGDSSSETSYSPDQDHSSNSTGTSSPTETQTMKLVDGDRTFILSTEKQQRRPNKRRVSGHRKEFHNVRS